MTDPSAYAPPHTRQQVALTDQVRKDAEYVRAAATFVQETVELITQRRNEIFAEDRPSVDPVVAGLLDHMPRSGAVWPEAERKQWIALLEGTFRLIYKDAASPSTP